MIVNVLLYSFLFNDALGIFGKHMVPNGRMILNNELEGMWKGLVVVRIVYVPTEIRIGTSRMNVRSFIV
jgi:hypothetical protein